MLQIADYRVDGMKLRVRLKCSCGGRRILKIKESNETQYQCASCKAQASMRKLKNEATTYWRRRMWEIEYEHPKKSSLERVITNYPARLVAQANRSAEPHCTLSGHCIEMSSTGLLFIAQDFRKSYFEGMSTKHRFALVQFTQLVHGLPPELRGTIVEIKFRDNELPICHIRVAFQLSGDEEKQVLAHLENLRGRVTEWALE